ncbi:transmembrane protein tincar isoform 2-T2 [Cochliomyia hominivorax]
MVLHDSLEEESRGGTLRILWTHGGPTAAFIHILIAFCLLLPRLLLESRVIENGLLPRENIWQSELDFIKINRRNLVILSVKSSPYQNFTYGSEEDEDYFNDTMFTYSNNGESSKNILYNELIENKNLQPISGKTKYFELHDLIDTTIKRNISQPKKNMRKSKTTIPPINYSTMIYRKETTLMPIILSTVDENYSSLDIFVDKETKSGSTPMPYPTHETVKNATKSKTKFMSSTSLNSNTFTHQIKHNQQLQNFQTNKSIRKHHRHRKISFAHRKNHQQSFQHQFGTKSSSEIDNERHANYNKYEKSIDLNNLDEINNPYDTEESNSGKIYEHRPTSFEELDFSNTRAAVYQKSSTPISTTHRNSNIHIIKPEKLPEIIPSTPLSSNSKIIEIKTKINKKIKREISSKEWNHVAIKPEYLVGDLQLNDSKEYIEVNSFESSSDSEIQTDRSASDITRLDGFAGMLQLFFGVHEPIDVNVFNHPPSAEFVNLLFALLVWCVRYPAVFWNTAKSFATIFSVQIIASAADIVFNFVGISNLFKLQIYSEGQQIQNSGLILNANVTLALFLLSVLLILSSSMVMYLYGHGRLSAKVRERSIISLKSNESWIYFAHCASLCYVLALSVVKVPLLNDLSATYRYNLHCPTFMAALVSVMNILLWIIIWLGLSIKRKWNFKLPPLDACTIIGKATTQPLLVHNRRSSTNTTSANLINSNTMGIHTSVTENTEPKINCENAENFISNASSSDVLNEPTQEDIYWPKITPSSPKLKVTFNEVASTSDDGHHRIIGEHEENNDKRNSPRGTSICFTSTKGEIDDGEYAILRSDDAKIIGITLDSSNRTGSSVFLSKTHTPTGVVKIININEYVELPPPPPNMISSMTITNHTTTVTVNPENNYVNCFDENVGKMLGDDNLSEEGKLLERVRDDSVTYASTRDLEPPLPPPPTQTSDVDTYKSSCPSMLSRNSATNMEAKQHFSTPNQLVSPLAPVKVAVHANEAYIASNSTPRCLRRADSGVPQEALTPRSDTNSYGTESTISPPDRAPSESSSGVHSAEEREVEVVIRPRNANKPLVKQPPPVIQEEPYGRCTNMRMSSFAGGISNSSTLPLQRTIGDEKFGYSQHCSTMPLPVNSHNPYEEGKSAIYATSAHCMSQTQILGTNVSSFKTPLYANSGVATSSHKETEDINKQTRPPIPPPPQVTHTTLPNGVRYSNPKVLIRHPSNKAADSLYSHQPFSKKKIIHEDRDSANYSMVSEHENLYATASSLN